MKEADLVGVYAAAFNKAGMAGASPVEKERAALRAVAEFVLEQAAQVFEKDDSQRWGYTADLAEIARGIRELKP